MIEENKLAMKMLLKFYRDKYEYEMDEFYVYLVYTIEINDELISMGIKDEFDFRKYMDWISMIVDGKLADSY